MKGIENFAYLLCKVVLFKIIRYKIIASIRINIEVQYN